VCLSAPLLGIVGFLVWQLILPPSADKLYAEAEKVAHSAREEDEIRALSDSGPIKRYLRHYGDREDDKTRRVREWADQAELPARGRKLRSLLDSKTGKQLFKIDPETEEERRALTAASLQEEGDLDRARAAWADLSKYQADKDAEKRSWGLLAAQKNARDLKFD